jgi:methyl-accepting chemotaxis protein
MVRQLFEFLNVDAETEASAHALSKLLVPHVDEVIEHFYNEMVRLQINPHVTARSIPVLKRKQKQHWTALFNSKFDEDYFGSIRQIGVRHRDIELSTMWYVAGYAKLKMAFIEVIIRSDLPVASKGQLIKTLDKYIAIDMALALSTYDAVILD